MATALFQGAIVHLSGSVALLADTLHNLGDAATAIPLWIAFRLARRKPSRRFPYGYGKAEDLAGAFIVLAVLASAAAAGYVSMQRFLHPQPVAHLWVVAAAAVVGFIGNEAVARVRIRIGREIQSAALVADGQHARIDALTSLAVAAGAAGVWLGHPWADPIVGLGITLVILRVAWSSAKAVLLRMLDGVDPAIVDAIAHTAGHVEGIQGVSEVRVRWIGHWLHGDVNLAVSPELSIGEAHALAARARHAILHHVPYLSNVVIHIDPADVSGEVFHRIENHAHDDLKPHFHP